MDFQVSAPFLNSFFNNRSDRSTSASERTAYGGAHIALAMTKKITHVLATRATYSDWCHPTNLTRARSSLLLFLQMLL